MFQFRGSPSTSVAWSVRLKGRGEPSSDIVTACGSLSVKIGAEFMPVTVSVTCGAGLYFESPAWSYMTVQAPVPPVIVNSAPAFVHAPDELYETGKPDEAAASTVKTSPARAPAGALVVTVIVWSSTVA